MASFLGVAAYTVMLASFTRVMPLIRRSSSLPSAMNWLACAGVTPSSRAVSMAVFEAFRETVLWAVQALYSQNRSSAVTTDCTALAYWFATSPPGVTRVVWSALFVLVWLAKTSTFRLSC